MNSIPTHCIITRRLVLRELNPVSYNQVMNSGNDAEIKTFFGMISDDELESERLRHHQGLTMTGRSFLYFHLLDKTSEEVLGWCGYHTWFVQHRRAEIGYVLNQEKSKRQGYMSEALPEVIRYGFEVMQLNRIEALLSPKNIPSLKLIERNKFIREGLLREHYIKNNTVEDSLIFSILRREYSGTTI